MHVHDPLIKVECWSCYEEFLVSEYVLKQREPGTEFPGDSCYCPYCGSKNTEEIVASGENMDYAEEMGCLAIGHFEIGEGEELKPWIVINQDTGESYTVDALGFLHALDIARRNGFLGVGSYTCEPVETDEYDADDFEDDLGDEWDDDEPTTGTTIDRSRLGCKCAKPTDQYHGWECEITGGECMFLFPSSKACAETYGEGPDAVAESEG